MPAPRRRRDDTQRARSVQASLSWPVLLRTWRARIFVVVLLLLAVVLRTTNLTAQSLWADEGNSVRVTDRPLRLVVDAARGDVHPPGYYLLLWAWVRLFGQSETAVRALSVLVGVALVALIYLTGRDTWNARMGWLAAFCAAVSPLQIQYSQEVRMYILVAFFAASVIYAFGCCLRAFGRDRRASVVWSVAYVALGAAGLWCHYSFPIVLAATAVAWVVWWAGLATSGERARAALWWIGLHVAMLLLYSPWLPVAWDRITAYGSISAPHTLGFVAAQWLKLLSVGETVVEDDVTRWLTFGMVGLVLFGVWAGFSGTSEGRDRRRRRATTLSLVTLTLAPALMMGALALAGRSAYRPKFFLVASPSFCLLLGSGIAVLERTTGPQRSMANRLWLLLGLGLVGAGAVRSLRNYYLDPDYARADYRGIAAYISSVARDRDAVLLNAPNQWEVFTYYYRSGVPVYPLPRSRPPIEAEVITELASIAARHDRLYVVLWAVEESDPERIVERWLAAHAYRATETWYGDVRLATYGMPVTEQAAAETRKLESTQFAEEIALRAYAIGQGKAQPGDLIRVELSWEALERPAGRYKVFLHLVGPDGQIAAQVDSEPGGGMNPTSAWTPGGGVFTDRYGLLVPADTPDGQYQLLMGMYDLAGAPRLPVTTDGRPAGEVLTLGTVVVESYGGAGKGQEGT